MKQNIQSLDIEVRDLSQVRGELNEELKQLKERSCPSTPAKGLFGNSKLSEFQLQDAEEQIRTLTGELSAIKCQYSQELEVDPLTCKWCHDQ